MKQELMSMTDVLLGREPAPIDTGASTLMEVAEAFHARAREMSMLLKDAEAEGAVLKGTAAYKFRTGMLRDFIQLVERSVDLGSRRITVAQLEARLQEFG
jgi:hypothetical protein